MNATQLHRDLTIIVCTRGPAAMVAECLQSVRAACASCELIVVENGAKSFEVANVTAEFGGRYVHEPVMGLSRARNRGLQQANGELVAFIDDDAVAHPHWIAGLATEFRDPEVAAVTGRIAARDGNVAAERLWELAGGTTGPPARFVLDRRTPGWFTTILLGRMGNGSNLAFRRRAFAAFDIRLGRGAPVSGGEENLALLQMAASGGRLVYTPDAIVYHHYPDSVRELRARYCSAMADTAALLVLVLLEFPSLRVDALRLVLSKFRGRDTGKNTDPSQPRLVSRWQALLWAMRGPWRYLKAQAVTHG